jgi:PAS domain-containing protein
MILLVIYTEDYTSIDVNLSLNIAEANQAKEEALRLNNALDNVHSAVMVANNNLEIVYMNARVRELFESAEEDIKNKFQHLMQKNYLVQT